MTHERDCPCQHCTRPTHPVELCPCYTCATVLNSTLCDRCEGFGKTLSHFDCWKCGGGGRIRPQEPMTPEERAQAKVAFIVITIAILLFAFL